LPYFALSTLTPATPAVPVADEAPLVMLNPCLDFELSESIVWRRITLNLMQLDQIDAMAALNTAL